MKLIQIATIFATGAIAIGGSSAYTAAISGAGIAAISVGAATVTVGGGVASSTVYTYNAGKTQITAVDVIFTGDVTADTLTLTPHTGGSTGTAVACVTGALNGGGDTPFHCAVVTGGDWTVAGLTAINFALTTT